MTLDANVLREDSVQNTSEGYEVAVYLPWYRSLPLSCLENVVVRLGDEQFSGENLRIVFEGESLALGELSDRVDNWWFVQDPLTVRVHPAGDLSSSLRAEVELAIRIPYILVGPDAALVIKTKAACEVIIK